MARSVRGLPELWVNRALAAFALTGLLGGAVAVVAATGRDGPDSRAPAKTERPVHAGTPAPPPPKRRTREHQRVTPLIAVGAYDPEGDGSENDHLAAAAVDRDPTSAWRTERYRSFYKHGVGLVLATRRPLTLARISVSSDTPGFVAEIRAGPAPQGPFRPISARRRISRRTTFALRRNRARYVVVWITDMPDGTSAHVVEVRAFARSA
jgi:hypothetical protein